MASRCEICSHENRLEIEKDIIAGTPLTHIQRAYNIQSYHTLTTHKHKHLMQPLIKRMEDKEILHSERLLSEITKMLSDTDDIKGRAKTKDWLNTELKAVGEKRNILDFVMRMAVTIRQEQDREAKKNTIGDVKKLKERLTSSELRLLLKLLAKAKGETDEVIEVQTPKRHRRLDIKAPVKSEFLGSSEPPIYNLPQENIAPKKQEYEDGPDLEGYTQAERMKPRQRKEVAGVIRRSRRRPPRTLFPDEAHNVRWS